MELFIILELIFLIAVTISCLIITIAIQGSARARKFPLLFYLRLASWFLVLYYITSIISILLKNEFFARIHVILLFPYIFFFILFVNNIVKETYYTNGVILVCSLGFLVIFLASQPNAFQLILIGDDGKFMPSGLLSIIYIIFWLLFIAYFFYWGFKTWSSSPFYMKKKALICFLAITLYVSGGILFSLLYLFVNSNFLIFQNVTNTIGLLILTIVIGKNIKLLYVIPHIIYRISVRDQKGNPLYDHDWSDLKITETIFTGFLNAIELMSEEIMNVGGILDINLNKGILIISRSEKITVGLIASKASKLLRDCVINFANDFEIKFERLLKKSNTDMNDYTSAYELINKYFSNIPYRFIKSKEQILTLSSKNFKIPQQIEYKFKDIFDKKEDYDLIIDELARSPMSIPSIMIDLYDELKDEIDELKLKDDKDKQKRYLNKE